jgi:hypothetical protein
MLDMRRVTLTIDGEEYIALPKNDYYRLLGKAPPDTIDALEFTLAALGEGSPRRARACRPQPGRTREEAEEVASDRQRIRERQDPRERRVRREGPQGLRGA